MPVMLRLGLIGALLLCFVAGRAAWASVAPVQLKADWMALQPPLPVVYQHQLPPQGQALGQIAYAIGLQLAARGQLLVAQPLLAKAADRLPEFVEGHLVYASVLEGLGRLAEAKTQYEQALAQDDNQPDAYYKLGLLLDALGDTEGGKSKLKRALQLAPKEPLLYYDLGVMAAKQNHYQEALNYAKQATLLDPTFAEALNNYAYALAQLQRYEESLEAINRSLSLKPESAASLDTRGFALFGLKRYEQALADYDAALAINPNIAEIHWHRGQVLEALNRVEDALAAYQLYLGLEPNPPDKALVEAAVSKLKAKLPLATSSALPSEAQPNLQSSLSPSSSDTLLRSNLSSVLAPLTPLKPWQKPLSQWVWPVESKQGL
ncbi:MAG: tetratricopeptide repeat protein [Vampirovibrionales bacterium]